MKRVDLRKNMLLGETSLVKPESLYAHHNAMLIQRISFLDMYACLRACVRVPERAYARMYMCIPPVPFRLEQCANAGLITCPSIGFLAVALKAFLILLRSAIRLLSYSSSRLKSKKYLPAPMMPSQPSGL